MLASSGSDPAKSGEPLFIFTSCARPGAVKAHLRSRHVSAPSRNFFGHPIPMNREIAIRGFEIDFDNFIEQMLGSPNFIKDGFEQLALDFGSHSARAID